MANPQPTRDACFGMHLAPRACHSCGHCSLGTQATPSSGMLDDPGMHVSACIPLLSAIGFSWGQENLMAEFSFPLVLFWTSPCGRSVAHLPGQPQSYLAPGVWRVCGAIGKAQCKTGFPWCAVLVVHSAGSNSVASATLPSYYLVSALVNSCNSGNLGIGIGN